MKKLVRSFSRALIVLSLLLCSSGSVSWAADAVEIRDKRPDGSANRAAWMGRGEHGIMVHYLIPPRGKTPQEKTADLNRIVDNYDVEYFLKQFDQTKADWLIITLGQTTGYFCAPNEYLDKLAPGHTPRRDLVREIAQGLRKRNKRLILYLASGRSRDPIYRNIFKSDNEETDGQYLDFVRSYAKRYGDLLSGWWFDGCVRRSDKGWQRWMDAARAGNPQAALAFSGAEFCCGGPTNPLCALEDYHAGEIHLLEDSKIRRDFLPPGGDIVVQNGKLRKRGQEARTYLPDGQFIDNVQWHCLLPIDLTFNPAVPNQFCHYYDYELFEFVERIKSVGGAITINVPLDRSNGHMYEDSLAQLARLGLWMTDKSGKRQPARPGTCWGTD